MDSKADAETGKVAPASGDSARNPRRGFPPAAPVPRSVSAELDRDERIGEGGTGAPSDCGVSLTRRPRAKPGNDGPRYRLFDIGGTSAYVQPSNAFSESRR